jgi:hypothetical protein
VKPKIAILSLLFYGIMIILPAFLFYIGELLAGFVAMATWVFVFGGMIIQCVVKRVEIGEEGVKYITTSSSYKMRWDEIKTIGIGYIPYRAPGRPPWIYFSAEDSFMPMLSANLVNSKFFIVHYRKELECAIKLHWKKGIVGLDSLR